MLRLDPSSARAPLFIVTLGALNLTFASFLISTPVSNEKRTGYLEKVQPRESIKSEWEDNHILWSCPLWAVTLACYTSYINQALALPPQKQMVTSGSPNLFVREKQPLFFIG